MEEPETFIGWKSQLLLPSYQQAFLREYTLVKGKRVLLHNQNHRRGMLLLPQEEEFTLVEVNQAVSVDATGNGAPHASSTANDKATKGDDTETLNLDQSTQSNVHNASAATTQHCQPWLTTTTTIEAQFDHIFQSRQSQVASINESDNDYKNHTTTNTSNNNHKMSSATSNSLNHFHTLIYANLPAHLTDEYRIRHQLSLDDIRKVLSCCTDRQLWSLALCRDYDIPATAVQVNATNPDAVVHRGGALIFQRLMAESENSSCLAQESRLICPVDTHQPPLPVHFVPLSTLAQLTQDVVNSTNTTSNQQPASVCRRVWRWRGIQVIVFRAYRGYLQLARVLPKSIYCQLYGSSFQLQQGQQCQRSSPLEYRIDGIVYCQANETFLVQARHNHHKIMQQCGAAANTGNISNNNNNNSKKKNSASASKTEQLEETAIVVTDVDRFLNQYEECIFNAEESTQVVQVGPQPTVPSSDASELPITETQLFSTDHINNAMAALPCNVEKQQVEKGNRVVLQKRKRSHHSTESSLCSTDSSTSNQWKVVRVR
jgi:hypothetical protein